MAQGGLLLQPEGLTSLLHLSYPVLQSSATTHSDKKPCGLSVCASNTILECLTVTKASQDQLGDLLVKFCFLSLGFDGTFV